MPSTSGWWITAIEVDLHKPSQLLIHFDFHCTRLKLGDSGFGNKIHCKEKVKGGDYKSCIDPQLTHNAHSGFLIRPLLILLNSCFVLWATSVWSLFMM